MDFRKVRKWQVNFEVHRQLRSLPVPEIVVEEVQNDRNYRLDGRLRGDSGGQLSITLGGRGGLRIAGTDYELTPGKAFLHNHNDPQVCYYYPPDGTEPWNFLWMAFYGDGLYELISEINGTYGYIFDVPLNSPLVERLSNYRQYRNEVLMMTPLEGGKLVIDVIDQLCSPVENELRESPRSSLVGDVQNRIANYISERLDVESMARHFRVSREHLVAGVPRADRHAAARLHHPGAAALRGEPAAADPAEREGDCRKVRLHGVLGLLPRFPQADRHVPRSVARGPATARISDA